MAVTVADDLTKYYDEVRSFLDCPEEEQNRLLSDVNKRVLELQADGCDLSYNDIVDFLGLPEDLASLLISDADPDVMQAYLRKQELGQKISRFLLIVIAVIIFASSTYIFCFKESKVFTSQNKTAITPVSGNVSYNEK